MITFFSNFINEHQIPFCNAMFKETGGEFRFVATEPISEERLSMGFVDQSDDFPYVVKSYNDYQEALRLGRESDVVIIGSAPDEFIVDRLKENKLTFRYSERYFKEGKWRICDPRVFLNLFLHDFRYRRKNLHMLCASAYTAPDCRFIFSYPKKTYKWGYFPPFSQYDDVEKVIEAKKPNTILWVGRMIPLKHPEDVIKAVSRLKKDRYDFRLKMIGEGVRKEALKKQIVRLGLQEDVEMLPFMTPEEVRKHMERADIYLFTSDHNEGWGAVLNESMSSACAFVGCREIGSVPYVVEHGKNGRIYDRHGKNSLYANVKYLLDNPGEKREMQRNAYNTMATLWNAEVASGRLLHLIDCINGGKEPEYENGPCSKDY